MTDKRPPHLTRGERERAGMTTVKLSRATRALIDRIQQGSYAFRMRTVDQVIYDLVAAALDSNGPLGPAERAKLEAPFRDGAQKPSLGSKAQYTGDRQYTAESRPRAHSIPALRNWPAHGVKGTEG